MIASLAVRLPVRSDDGGNEHGDNSQEVHPPMLRPSCALRQGCVSIVDLDMKLGPDKY